MSEPTNGTAQIDLAYQALKGLRAFLALPEAERIPLLDNLSKHETIALYWTANKVRIGSGRDWDPPGTVYDTDPVRVAMSADITWMSNLKEAGAFQEHAGKFIAVFGQQLVGHGEDYTALLHEVAGRLGVDQSRITIEYIERDDEPWY